MDPPMFVPEMIRIGKDSYDMGDLSAAMQKYEEAMNSLIRFENSSVPVYSRSHSQHTKATTHNKLTSLGKAKPPIFKTSSPVKRNNYEIGKLHQCKRALHPRKTNFLDEPFIIDSVQKNNHHYSSKSLACILLFNMALVEYKAGFLSTSAQLFADAIVSYKEDIIQQGSSTFLSGTYLPGAASNNLGYLYFENGLLNDAVESFLEAFRFGQNALRQINGYEYPVTILQEDIMMLKKKLAMAVHNVAVTFNFIGESYQKDGEVVQAMRIFKMANNTRKLYKCFTGEDKYPSVYLITLYNVGLIHYRLGNNIEAMQALDLLRSSRGDGYSYEENRVIFSVMFNMGKMALDMGDPRRALAFFKKAVSIGDKISTTVLSRNMSRALYQIGRIHSTRGEYGEAIESLSRALEIERGCLGSDHPDLVLTLIQIGQVHHKCGRLNCALETLKEGLRIAKKSIGEGHDINAQILSTIGVVCLEGGKFDEAAEAFAQASNFSSHGQTVEDENIPCDLTIRALPSVMLAYPQGSPVA